MRAEKGEHELRILSFTVRDFRNISRAQLQPAAQLNILIGDNGQGKTSLLEGIWLFTGCRSFRGAEYSELVREGADEALLEIFFESNGREQSAQLNIKARRRSLGLNGFAQETPRRMLGVFPAVAFTPGSLALVQAGPGERRRFLDVALSMRMPAYAVRLAKYLKTLAQRNALLRGNAQGLEAQLDVWDTSLAREAAQIAAARQRHLELLIPRAREFYRGISGGRETLDAIYKPAGIKENCSEETYLMALRNSRARDLRMQATHAGPHRDDLLLTLDDRALRDFGSQGQQRTAALALKLAEAEVLRETIGEQPIALLDDVMSELDPARQRALLQYLEGWQVFLTCCAPLGMESGAKVFRITKGMAEAI